MKYPRGRPKAGEVRDTPGKIPKPPQMGVVPALRFFQYWAKTDLTHPSRLQLYVYRRWPTVNRDKLGLKRYLEVLTVGDQVTREDILPETAEGTFLHRYGSGDYKLMLCDGAARGQHISTCMLTLRDQEYLPVINPMESLILEDPTNRPFIEDCRRKGILVPGDIGTQTQGEADDMAQVTAVTAGLTDTIKELVGQNAAMADKAIASTQKQVQAQTTQDAKDAAAAAKPASGDALASVVDGMSKAWEAGNLIMKSAMDNASKVNTADPVKTMEGFVNLAKLMAPPAAPAEDKDHPSLTTSLIKTLMEREQKANEAASVALKDQNDLLRMLIMGRPAGTSPILPGLAGSEGLAPVGGTQPAIPGIAGYLGQAQPQPQPKTVIESIRELATVKADLQELLGIGGGDEEGAGKGTGGWKEYLPMMIQGAIMITSTVSTIFHNMAVARSGGMPINPADVTNQLAAAQNQVQSQQQDNGLPPPPPAGPDVQIPTDPTLAAYHVFLGSLREPIIQALNNGESGEEFAEKLVNWQGQMAYDYLREMGPDKLIGIISTYPPIWEYVSKVPVKFEQFLIEFLAYGDPEPPEMPASAVPAVVHKARSERKTSPEATSDPLEDPLAHSIPASAPGVSQGGVHHAHPTPPNPQTGPQRVKKTGNLVPVA